MNHHEYTIISLIVLGGCMGMNPSSISEEDMHTHACTLHLEILSDPGGRVSWLHEGNLIAFDNQGTDGYYDVYSIRTDGTGLVCLTDNHSQMRVHNGNPSWHPSGTYIVFQSQDAELHLDTATAIEKFVSSPGIGMHNNLWIMTSTGSQFWQLTQVEKNHGVLHPHFSPDGTMLLWTEIINSQLDGMGHWAIKLADFTVGEDGPLLNNIQTLRPQGLQLYEVHGFSPDGKTILFSGIEKGGYYYDMEIYLMNLSTHSLTQLTVNDEWDEHAHFIAGGSHIVWVSSEGVPQPKRKTLEDIIQDPPKLEYWIMNPDGTDKRRLSFFNDPSNPAYMDITGGVGLGDFDPGPQGFTLVAKIREGSEKEVTVLITWYGDCTKFR